MSKGKVISLVQLCKILHEEGHSNWILDDSKPITNIVRDGEDKQFFIVYQGNPVGISLHADEVKIIRNKNWQIDIVTAGGSVVARLANTSKRAANQQREKDLFLTKQQKNKTELESLLEEQNVRILGAVERALEMSPGFTASFDKSLNEIVLVYGTDSMRIPLHYSGEKDITVYSGANAVRVSIKQQSTGCECCGSHEYFTVKINDQEIYTS